MSRSASRRFKTLLRDIRACRECEPHLPLGARPMLSASATARLLVIGQAPGRRAHENGVPWSDASGDRLRGWLGIAEDKFYDEALVAIVPMGFCYPGAGASGDLPPRPECARLWHERLLGGLTEVKLKIVTGAFAHKYVLGDSRKATLTQTVRNWKEFRPAVVPLPHPSPRNNRWLKQNPWFEAEVVPYLRRRVRRLLATRS